MGLWDTSPPRKVRRVSGSVLAERNLESAITGRDLVRHIIHEGTGVPIARFTRSMPHESAELAGLDIYFGKAPGVFLVDGGDAIGMSDFADLVRRGLILVRATSDDGYGSMLDDLLAGGGSVSDGTGFGFPPEYLNSPEAAACGVSFTGTPEIEWLGKAVTLHSAAYRYLRDMEDAVEAAERDLAESREPRGPGFRIAVLPPLLAVASVPFPGIAKAFRGDPVDAVFWVLGTPMLALLAYMLSGGSHSAAVLTWAVLATAAVHSAGRPAAGGERPMAAAVIVVLAFLAADSLLLGGYAIGTAAAAAREASLTHLPEGVAGFVLGPAEPQYAAGGLWGLLLAGAGLVTAIRSGGERHAGT